MSERPADNVKVSLKRRAAARSASGRRVTTAERLNGALIGLGILFFTLFALFPFIFMISGSFKALIEITSGFPTIFPKYPTLENYQNTLFGNQLVQTSYPLNVRNSLAISAMTVVLCMAIALPAALALARQRTWWTTLVSGWVRIAQVVGGIIVLIPLFLILHDLQLVNTLFAVSLVEAIPGSAFGIFILSSFIRQIPTDLDDAAEIDGASQLQTLRHVIVPLARPGILSVVLLVFMLSWNDFLNPLILLQDPGNYTITLGLNNYIGTSEQIEWGRLLAVCAMSCIPPVLLIVFAERHIVRGLAAGAVKE